MKRMLAIALMATFVGALASPAIASVVGNPVVVVDNENPPKEKKSEAKKESTTETKTETKTKAKTEAKTCTKSDKKECTAKCSGEKKESCCKSDASAKEKK